MGEILIMLFFFSVLLMGLVKSMMNVLTLFFLFSLLVSLMTGYFYSGWLGAVIFLVFVGGILVMVFYLSMFGNYYNFSKVGLMFFFSFMIMIPVETMVKFKVFNIGESSDMFFNYSFYLFMGGFLFLILMSLSKIVGFGGSLRRFF